MIGLARRLARRDVRFATLVPRLSRQPALRALGGPGSGNFGHEGRPGKVGGSGPGGGEKKAPLEMWKTGVGSRGAFLRLRDPNTSEGAAMIEALEQFPVFTGTLYRGLSLSKEEVDQLLGGDDIKIELSSSASKDRNTALQFLVPQIDKIPVLLEIQGSGRDISVPGGKDEEEVVLMPKTRLKFVSSGREEIRTWKRATALKILLREVKH